MEPSIWLLFVLAGVVVLLIRAEMLKQRQQMYIFKPMATLLVIALALLSFVAPKQNLVYSVCVLIGLIFSFGGDVALLFQEQRKAFGLGLVLFLLAHVAYAVTFATLGQFSASSIGGAIVLLAIGIGFYSLIQTNLGTMRLPVIIYMIVISVMVILSVSTLTSPIFSGDQATLIIVGAILFFISDIILAANRFWKPWQYHRISLAFYYAGQAGIALAASYFA